MRFVQNPGWELYEGVNKTIWYFQREHSMYVVQKNTESRSVIARKSRGFRKAPRKLLFMLVCVNQLLYHLFDSSTSSVLASCSFQVFSNPPHEFSRKVSRMYPVAHLRISPSLLCHLPGHLPFIPPFTGPLKPTGSWNLQKMPSPRRYSEAKSFAPARHRGRLVKLTRRQRTFLHSSYTAV